VNLGNGDSGGVVHARPAGGAGVDEGDAVLDNLFRLMGVAKDDHVGFIAVEDKTARLFGEVVRPACMDDEELLATERAAFYVAEAVVAQAAVGVAEDGGDGRKGVQLGQERFAADVAGVQDVPDAVEQRGNPRVEVTVRVADEADFHCRYDIDFCRAGAPA
jgi:hypothetical protein